MKFSKKRELILNEVMKSKEHPTADKIYENLRRENPNLSLGTVYRNLTQLEENGYIGKINIPGDPVRYDGNLENHDHFVCESCGMIFDIQKNTSRCLNKPLEKSGFKINSSYIILRGICSDCLENNGG